MSGIGRVVSLLLLTGFVAGSTPASQPRSLGDLTGPWELMVDDHLIQEKQGWSAAITPFTSTRPTRC